MKNIKLLALTLGAVGLVSLITVIAVGPANAAAFTKRTFETIGNAITTIGRPAEVEELLENIETKGTTIEEGKGWWIKKYQAEDGKEAIMMQVEAGAEGEVEEYIYETDSGRVELKMGPISE